MTRDRATDHDFVLLPVLTKLAPTVPEARATLEKWVRANYGDSRTLATISSSALGTDPAFAPSAIRTPISARRRETMYDTTP